MSNNNPLLNKADKYISKAKALVAKANFSSALDEYENAKIIYEKFRLWKEYIIAINGVANMYFRMGKYEESLKYLNEGEKICEKELGIQDTLLYEIKDLQAKIHIRKNEFEDAFRILKNTQEAREQFFPDNEDELFKTYHLLSLYYMDTDKYTLQKKYSDLALHVKLSNGKAIDEGVARIYNNTGLYYYERGNYKKSIEYYFKARDIYEALPNDNGYLIATTYSNTGLSFERMGDYDKALSYHKKALKTRIRLFGEYHIDVAISYNNLGVYHYYKKNKELTYINFLKAKEISEEVLGGEDLYTALFTYNIGNYYRLYDDLDMAIQFHQKALEIRIHCLGENHTIVGSSYVSIGEVYLRRGDLELALISYQKGLENSKKGKNSTTAEAYYGLGEVYLEKKEYLKSLSYYQKAITYYMPEYNNEDIYDNPTLESYAYSRILIDTFREKAKVFYKLYKITNEPKDLLAAFNTYELSAIAIDKLRQNYQTEESKHTLSGTAMPLYENFIEVSLELYKNTADEVYKEKAFLIAEKGKAMSLIALMNETEAKITANLPEHLLEKEHNIYTELMYIDKQINRERAKGANLNKEKLSDWESEYFDCKLEYEKLIKEFEINFKEYYDLKYNQASITIEEVQAVLNKDTALIEYFVGQKNIYVFIFSDQEFNYVKIKNNQKLTKLHESLQESIDLLEVKDFEKTAIDIYEIILMPIEEYFYDKEHLIFINDDVLNYIPFDVLIKNKNEEARYFNQLNYLINKYVITHHYSVSLYIKGVNKRSKIAFSEKSFLGIAPVNFGHIESESVVMESSQLTGHETKVLRATNDNNGINKLPETIAEVKEVYNLFENKQLDSAAFLYGSASKKNLYKYANRYNYLLIATHGFVNQINAKLSGIYLAKNKEGEDDGKLYISDAYQLNLNANLVVLSSCSSGIGELHLGEGLIAINRGFLYAGAANIIYSLFDIPDASTSMLVKLLFKHILDGDKYSVALRKAKMQLMKKEEMTIQDWAGLALIGQ